MTVPSIPSAQANSYFVTFRLAPRSGDLLTRHINTLRSAMRYTISQHPTHIDAMAVLPNIIHAVWTLPPQDRNIPKRIGMFKARFSRAMPMPQHRTLTQIQRGEKGIWERRYWSHRIVDASDLSRHVDLVHLSPVHAGLCVKSQDWPYSSIHRAALRDAPPTSPPLAQQRTAQATQSSASLI